MAQAESLDLKPRPVEREKWTVKRLTGALAPLVAAVELFKTINTVGSLGMIFIILCAGIGELFGRPISWLLFSLVIFCGIINLIEIEKHNNPLPPKK